MAMSLLLLGSVAHLLEDMGVPAHTRNDFLFGHYKTWYDYPWGNDLENWVEKVVKDSNGHSPWSGSLPVVFDKLAKYFDADAYLGSYLGDGVLPPNTWGLSECSNYQFLSTSTMFGCSGTKYQFPHPAIEHTPPNLFEVVPDGNKVYFNGSNYGVSHLARESYTYYIATGMGYYGPLIDNTNTTDDTGVFEDYANITVPRTINYATGLINYFFRGKLSIEQTDCNNGKIVITITNKSSNSDVNQILKGGTFALYWDDSSGNRTPVSDFTVYRPGTEPGAGNEWNSGTLMNYDESTKAVLTPPTSGDAQYVLVYEGTISANPASPDPYDLDAIAVSVEAIDGANCSDTITLNFIDVDWYSNPYVPSGISNGVDYVLTKTHCEDPYTASNPWWTLYIGDRPWGWGLNVRRIWRSDEYLISVCGGGSNSPVPCFEAYTPTLNGDIDNLLTVPRYADYIGIDIGYECWNNIKYVGVIHGGSVIISTP